MAINVNPTAQFFKGGGSQNLFDSQGPRNGMAGAAGAGPAPLSPGLQVRPPRMSGQGGGSPPLNPMPAMPSLPFANPQGFGQRRANAMSLYGPKPTGLPANGQIDPPQGQAGSGQAGGGVQAGGGGGIDQMALQGIFQRLLSRNPMLLTQLLQPYM